MTHCHAPVRPLTRLAAVALSAAALTLTGCATQDPNPAAANELRLPQAGARHGGADMLRRVGTFERVGHGHSQYAAASACQSHDGAYQNT